MSDADKHKFCTKCLKEREIQKAKDDGTYKKTQTKILGSRPQANFIMFDGEGHYQKKQNLEHQNHKVQIEMTWKNQNNIDIENQSNKDSNCQTQEQSLVLPKIYNHKNLPQNIEAKPIMTDTILRRFGKYSQRYLTRTDPLNQNEKQGEEYTPTSLKYGRFYLSEEQKPQKITSEYYPFDGYHPISPEYKVFPVEKPILKYHSMKSQLFKSKM